MKEFLRRLKRGEKHDLSSILARANPDDSFEVRLEWFEQLLEWVRYSTEDQPNQSVRIKFLLQIFERHPEWKLCSAQLIRSLIHDSHALRLFAETGVPSWTSISAEFMARLVKVYFPSAQESNSLKNVMERVFYDDEDHIWLALVPESMKQDLWNWIFTGVEAREKFTDHLLYDLVDANLVLSVKSAAIAFREDFAARAPYWPDLLEHPLLQIEASFRRLHALLRQARGTLNDSELEKLETLLLDELSRGRDIIEYVKNHLEMHGVSVDLVYQRDRLKLYLERMQVLSTVVFSVLRKKPDARQRAYDLMVLLIQGENYDRDFSFLVKKNMSLISKKIVDFTGSTGETYIAQSSHDYWHFFWCAAGGGFLTAFTAVIKYSVSSGHWPLFVQFYYAFLNYSMSFLLMHALHFKLATKQPSMTAAALASKLKEVGNDREDEDFVEEIAKITRSQFASVYGNIVAVIPTALAFNYVWKALHGSEFLSVDEAHHVLESINPWETLTVVYAAFTGVVLWLSGITSGWVENAVVYYRVPEVIRHHKMLKKLVGPKLTEKVASSLLRNVSGIVGAVSLGFYLAAFPILGKFFGLPIDIRHITLTTGAVTLAVHAIGASALTTINWVSIVLGITLIGTMNFSISFLLAIFVAVRAKEVRGRRMWKIFKKSLRELNRSPIKFLLPFRTEA